MGHSTPRLSEVARHLVIPDGISTSVWPRVEQRLATVDLGFDRWQQGLGAVAFGCGADGTYAATIGGVVVSIPRQVGKTYTVGGAMVGIAAEFPGSKIVWTSHHNRTNTNTFQAMSGLVTRPKLKPLLARNGVRRTNGEQEIRFGNSSVIMFGAREQGFGRGIDGVDFLVLDEAQILGAKALEDMVPSTNQSTHPHGALIFFIGTPPRPTDDGAAFTAKRKAALDGRTNHQVFVELSADPDADPDDREQWAKANPSFPHRTPLEAMLRMRENLPDDAAWRREALGIWDPEVTGSGVIDLTAWAGLQVPTPDADWLAGEVCFGIEGPPSGDYVSVVAAGMVGDRVGIELAKREPGTEWLLPWAIDANERHQPKGFTFDPKSATADAHMAAFRAAGLPVIECGFADRALPQATIGINDDIHNDRLRVLSHPLFDAAVEGAERRYLGESWLWNRKAGVDPTPLVAATLARWGLLLPVEAAPEPFFFYAD